MCAQQIRAVHTREAILRAAAEVFDEYGYAAAGIGKIIERAGVTSGALYFHFDGKQELAIAVMCAQPDAVGIELDSAGLQRAVDISLLWSLALQNDPFLRAGVRLTGEQAVIGVLDPTPYTQWVDILAECLREAVASGEALENVDPPQVAEFLVAACTGMQEFAMAVSGRKDLSERVVHMWRLLLPGLAAPGVFGGIRLSVQRARDLYQERADIMEGKS